MWICHGDSPDLSGTKPVFFKRVSLRFCDNQFPVFLHTSFHILYFVTDWCEPGYRKTVRRETPGTRSEEHTSELQSLMRISYAVFCLKKKKKICKLKIKQNNTSITLSNQ